MVLIWTPKKTTGPRTDPCGIPLLTSDHVDDSPLIITRCFLSARNPLIHMIHLIRKLSTLYSRTWMRRPCGTVSKAFMKSPHPHSRPYWRSSMTGLAGRSRTYRQVQSSRTFSNWRMVERPGEWWNDHTNLWRGCAAPVFDRIPLAKEILVENIPLAKEDFLIMSPFLHDFKEFQLKYSLFKRNFPKTDANLAPKCQFLRVFVKNIPLAKDFGRKVYPWLRNFCQKYTLG